MLKPLRRTDWYPLLLLVLVMTANNSNALTWWLWAAVAVFGAVGLFAGIADKISPAVERRWIEATTFGICLLAISHMWGWRNSAGWHIGIFALAIALILLMALPARSHGANGELR